MKRIIACVVVLVSVLVAPAARAQTSPGSEPSWSPREVRPAESAGEVVLKFTTKEGHAGRWVYYTRDGDCSRYPEAEDPANSVDPVSPADCGRPIARSGEDYAAVRGEWTITEPGSRTVRIPIFDDDLDETDGEAFTINASRHDDLAATTVWYNATIRIGDDDPKEGGGPTGDASSTRVTTTVVPRAEQWPPGSLAVDTAAGRTGSHTPTSSAPIAASGAPVRTTIPSTPPDLEVALPSRELEPGPGFELVSEQHSKPASERDDPSRGFAAWWPWALGATAVGSGGVVWLRRLRRWSPTRP